MPGFSPMVTLQTAVDAVLRHDPDTLTAVRGLAGKVIAIEISGPDIPASLHFHEDGVALKKEPATRPDVTIRARPLAFLGVLLHRGDDTTSFSPDMEIIGDAGLAQRFQQILKNMDIDWEEHLSHFVGDTAAHKLGRIFKHTREYVRETRQTVGMDISEYLRYEKAMLPDRDEVEEFITAVDSLRNDAERLKQHIDNLQRKITANVQSHG